TISSFISTRWKIKEEDLRTLIKESKDGYLRCEGVNIAPFSDAKYFLAVHSNGTDEDPTGQYLFLYIELGKEKKVEAVFDFSINSANFNCGLQYIFEKIEGWGYLLCSAEEFFDSSNGYFVDGILTINLNGILMVEKEQYITLNVKNEVALKTALKRNDKDFMIVVGNKQIQ
uniref:Uncharacterized protein n=1 Tax=Panagrolaimus sp. PS1159 TaxID=55785 RepID=A0AC35G8E0_9BILA